MCGSAGRYQVWRLPGARRAAAVEFARFLGKLHGSPVVRRQESLPWHGRCLLSGAKRGSLRQRSKAAGGRRLTCGVTAPPAGIAPDAMHFRRNAMTALVNFVNSIRRNEEGQDLLEYALLVALIAVVAVGAITAAGTSVQAAFQAIAAAITV
jgi:pilus assembly protein Flp/PilA